MRNLKTILTFVTVLLFSMNQVFAQRALNINNEQTVKNLLRQSGSTQLPLKFLSNVERYRVFDYNPQLKALTSDNKGDILLLDFFEDKQYKAVISNVTRSYDGIIGITAKIENTDFAYCYISISEEGIAVSAEFPQSDEQFIIGGKNGECYLAQHKISELRKNELPCEEVLPPEPDLPSLRSATDITAADCSSPGINNRTDENATIKVLVVYTAKAKAVAESNSFYGGTIDNNINQAMLRANQVAENSQTGITFELAYKYQTDYTEVNSGDDLDNITNTNDGYMDEVHALRKQYNADLVMLIPSVSFTGGLGWVLNTESGFPAYAFALSRVEQTSWTYTMIHEIGHNMGCAHHKLQGGRGLYTYSYGWRGSNTSGEKYSTVMTYEDLNDGQGYFPNIAFFSDPNIIEGGVNIGDVSDGNNALTLRKTKHVTALYSDVINTSLTDLEISSGTLSPAFSPDCFDYTVNDIEVGVKNITVIGIPNYDCAMVTGNVENFALTTVPQKVTISVRSHDYYYPNQKIYTVTVYPSCGSYESRPPFNGDVSAFFGSELLNLNMDAVAPVGQSDIPYGMSYTYIAIDKWDEDKIKAYSATADFRTLPIGEYTIYGIPYSYGSDPDDFIGKTLSEIQASDCIIPSQTSINVIVAPPCGSYESAPVFVGDISDYVGSDALNLNMAAVAPAGQTEVPYGMSYTYIAVDKQDNKIKGYSATADFRTLPIGDYTIYGAPHSNGNNPAEFIDQTVEEIEDAACVILSTTSINLTAAPLCDSYASLPFFTGDVSGFSGSDVLNLNMEAAVPVLLSPLTITPLPQATTSIYIRYSSGTTECHFLGNYFVHSGPVTKIKVTETGNYTFTQISGNTVGITVFNSGSTSCESFLNSTAYWAGEGTSTYFGSSIMVSLNAGTEYYMRTFAYGNPSTWNISITGPGTAYTESAIPTGMLYTYIAVNNEDGKIKSQSATADFRALDPGTYTIYGVPYSYGRNPDTFIGKTLSEIQASDCVIPSVTSIEMTVIQPPVYTWNPGDSGSDDWTLNTNWYPDGVPDANSWVIIPKNATYPVLKENTAISEIWFSPGAEIGRQDLLTYEKAFVQLDFSEPASRDRWYMLSNPLQQLYPGDFSFGGYPGMDMKLFELVNDKAVWKRIEGLNQSFSVGDAFIVWLASDPTGKGTKGLISSKGILELPYFDNPDLADVHWTHHYTAPTSTFGGWEEKDGSIVGSGTPVTATRDPIKAYRLAGKTVEEALNFGDGHFAIAGNPYMSSIDFAKLQEENSSVITGTYYIWIGPGGTNSINPGSYAIYNVLTGITTGRMGVELNDSIVPMQAFIVDKVGTNATSTLVFDLDKIGATGGNARLRSAAPQVNKLDIIASTAQAGVRTVIVSRQAGGSSLGSADSRKLFGEINNNPEVYTLKSAGANNKQVATSVNVLGEITGETLIPLAISTTHKGELSFTFTGMDTYNARISLLDTETNTETELTDKAQYEYRFNYVPEQSGEKIVANESRFFIRMNKSFTEIEEIALEAIRIYAPYPGTLQVVSTHPLRQVTVYNLQGSVIYNTSAIQANTQKVEGIAAGVYIVKAVSGNTVKAEKVVVKN